MLLPPYSLASSTILTTSENTVNLVKGAQAEGWFECDLLPANATTVNPYAGKYRYYGGDIEKQE